MNNPRKRKAFFSFHYQRDAWRASQIRNCNVVAASYLENDFIDAAAWETLKRQGDASVKRWIDKQLEGTSVTVVLIGAKTSEREYVKYEIIQSYNRGNGLLGICLSGMQNHERQTESPGANPFQQLYLHSNQQDRLSNHVPIYNWISDDGRSNIGKWIEAAAKKAGK